MFEWGEWRRSGFWSGGKIDEGKSTRIGEGVRHMSKGKLTQGALDASMERREIDVRESRGGKEKDVPFKKGDHPGRGEGGIISMKKNFR